jgi:DNA-binding transcriptional MerR regulator
MTPAIRWRSRCDRLVGYCEHRSVKPGEVVVSRSMRIGELSTRSGRSVHTIRWYEAQRLIPGVVRDAAGHRIYGPMHVGWMELIDRLRRTGMSVRQMREFTGLVKAGDSTVKRRREVLLAHRRRVEGLAEYMAGALELINFKIDYYESWLATGIEPKDAQPRKRVRGDGAAVILALPQERLKGE